MCTINDKKWKIATEDMVAYKVVNISSAGRYISQFLPTERSRVSGYKSSGQNLLYEVGKIVHSPSGPGIMAYINMSDAIKEHMHGWEKVLRVKIKKGTKYRTGENDGLPILTAQEIEVEGVETE